MSLDNPLSNMLQMSTGQTAVSSPISNISMQHNKCVCMSCDVLLCRGFQTQLDLALSVGVIPALGQAIMAIGGSILVFHPPPLSSFIFALSLRPRTHRTDYFFISWDFSLSFHLCLVNPQIRRCMRLNQTLNPRSHTSFCDASAPEWQKLPVHNTARWWRQSKDITGLAEVAGPSVQMGANKMLSGVAIMYWLGNCFWDSLLWQLIIRDSMDLLLPSPECAFSWFMWKGFI